jgi:hypothetical protein
MRLLRKSILPILIGSGLILVAASSSPTRNSAPSNLRPAAENSQARKADDQPATHYEPTTLTPSHVVTSPTPVLNQNADRDTEQGKYQAAQYRLNRFQTWFNGLLVLFTAALVAVGGWQARRLRQSVEATKETAEAAKKSADATEIAANAAKTSAEALIRSEWPRLLFERFDAIGPIPKDHPPPDWPNVIVGFRNYGRTAAFVTEIFIGSQLVPDLPPDPTYWSPIPVKPVVAVPPNERFIRSRYLAGPLRREDLDAILQGKTNYWVYGYVNCLDFRGDTHMTGFCARWRVEPDVWSHDGPPNYTYNYHAEGH